MLIAGYYRVGRFSELSALMGYEILNEEGGVVPEADPIRLRPTDELWDKAHFYTVYETEDRVSGVMPPFFASTSGHPHLRHVIKHVGRKNTPETHRAPWRAVGNEYLARRHERRKPDNFTVFLSN